MVRWSAVTAAACERVVAEVTTLHELQGAPIIYVGVMPDGFKPLDGCPNVVSALDAHAELAVIVLPSKDLRASVRNLWCGMVGRKYRFVATLSAAMREIDKLHAPDGDGVKSAIAALAI